MSNTKTNEDLRRIKVIHETITIQGEWGVMKWQVENEGGGNFINLIEADVCKDRDSENGFHIENEEDIDIMCEGLKKLFKTKVW